MPKKKNPAAMAMVKARMKKLSPERRAEIAKKAAEARWKGHKAQRPASSRKSGRGPGRPRKDRDEINN